MSTEFPRGRGRLLTLLATLGLAAVACSGGTAGTPTGPEVARLPASTPGGTASSPLPGQKPGQPRPGSPATNASGPAAPATSGAGSTTAVTPGAPYKGEIGVTSSTIKLGFLYPRSGPYGAVLRNVQLGIDAAVADVNAKGGVYGRKVDAVYADDGLNNASVALASMKAFKDQVFGVWMLGSATFAATHRFVTEHKIPTLYYVAERAAALRVPTAFPSITHYESQAELMPSFMIAKFNARTKRIGIVVEPTPVQQAAVETFKPRAKAAGLRVVITQEVPSTPSSCVNEVAKLQDKDVEIVYLANGGVSAACVIRDAEAVGFRPIWTAHGGALQVNELNAAVGCRNEGMLTMGAFHTMDDPESRRFRAAMRSRYPGNPDAEEDNLAFAGWGVAQYWIEAVRRSGSKPTRASFVVGMETMRSWQSDFGPPMTFGRHDRRGSRSVLTVKVQNCRWKTVDSRWRDSF